MVQVKTQLSTYQTVGFNMVGVSRLLGTLCLVIDRRGGLKTKSLSSLCSPDSFLLSFSVKQVWVEVQQKSLTLSCKAFCLVGVSRFELPTPRPPDEYSKPG